MSAVGSILTNMGALNALNSLSTANSEITTSEAELSSGLVINTPAANPAGYIEAQGFTSQVNGQDQALTNINTGISLAETAQGGITQQTDIAQKLYSMAVEAANGTETASERSSLQSVAQQLIGQINNISSQTQFNGINLLDGTFSGVQFQTGAQSGQTSALSINSTSASNIGTMSKLFTSVLAPGGKDDMPNTKGYYITHGIGYSGNNQGFINGNLSIYGANGTSNVAIGSHKSARQIASAINAVSGTTGVKATANTTIQFKLGGGSSGLYTLTLGVDQNGDSAPGTTPSEAYNGVTATQLVSDINSDFGAYNVSASMNSSGMVTMTASSGADIQIYQQNWVGQTMSSNIFTASGRNMKSIGSYFDEDVVFSGDVSLTSNSKFSLGNGSLISTENHSNNGSALSSIDLSTASGAEKAMGIIQTAISQLGQIGANIGAFQDGLESLSSNLEQSTSNATTALSAVKDADIPQVTNNLTEEQIYAQSGVAALKESSQLQQSFMSLLP